MTTIAWDGKTLAADRASGGSGFTDGSFCKLARSPGGLLAGAAGSLTIAARFLDWVRDGAQGDRPPLGCGDTNFDTEVLLIHPAGRMEFCDKAGGVFVSAPYYALGSGTRFALGAMAVGASAERAVRAACLHDDGSAGPVDVLVLGAAPIGVSAFARLSP